MKWSEDELREEAEKSAPSISPKGQLLLPASAETRREEIVHVGGEAKLKLVRTIGGDVECAIDADEEAVRRFLGMD